MHSGNCAALAAIARFGESMPELPALLDASGLTLSYGELSARITALGRRLRDADIGHGETVAVLVPQGVQRVLAVAGVMDHCCCAPLQPTTTGHELESTLRKLSASALVVSSEFKGEAEAARALGLIVVIARSGVSPEEWQVCRPSSPPMPRTVCFDATLRVVTSATTGDSKLVSITVANLDAAISARINLLQLTASDRLLLLIPATRRLGITNALAQVLVGGSVIAVDGFDPTAYVRWLDDLRPTWYGCSPTVHRATLARLNRESPRNRVSLRFVESTGARFPAEVCQGLEQALCVPVFNLYGMTEVGPIAGDAFMPGGRRSDFALRSCGPEIGIMDRSGALVRPGDEGEIVVRGPAVISGYSDNRMANRAAFRNGWFRTGDAGRQDTAGNLYVNGRLKEMINRGGEKIWPAEVDAALEAHPAVLEAAAFAVPHPTLGEDVAAAVVLRSSVAPPVGTVELRRFVAQRLAAFKLPRRICFVDQIPRGELDKPQRWLLAERLCDGRTAAPRPAGDARRSTDDADWRDVTSQILGVWERILNRDDLDSDADFFDVGGDSLAAISMLAEVDEFFGSQTSESPASFLQEPTIARLAELVRMAPPGNSRGAATHMQVYRVGEGQARQRLFCVGVDWGGNMFRRIGRHLDGRMDLVILHTPHAVHSGALYSLERAGEEIATLIRRELPKGPIFVCGHCVGGVMAVEAARILVRDGHDVRLVLFDALMPGAPAFLTDWRPWVEFARRRLRVAKKGGRAVEATNRRLTARNSGGSTFSKLRVVLGWALTSARRFARRSTWHWLSRVRPLLLPVEHVRGIEWMLRWVQIENFPLYRTRPVHAPILHFLSTHERTVTQDLARFGWRKMARRGLVERLVPLDHGNILHESNLPAIASAIRQWSGT